MSMIIVSRTTASTPVPHPPELLNSCRLSELKCRRITIPISGIKAIILFIVGLLFLPFSSYSLVFETFQGKVVAVKDGDSIVVLRNGKEIQIRLNGVDAPESGQAFGSRATKFTLASCYHRVVTVREVGLDRYGRTLAEVTLPDGKSFNQEIVRSGYARWFRRYSEDKVLMRLEEEARMAKRGLWADKNPIPPWEFRHLTSLTDTGIVQTAIPQPETGDQSSLVYVTSSGKKYHKKTCKALQGKVTAIPYSQAVGKYGACKICGGK